MRSAKRRVLASIINAAGYAVLLAARLLGVPNAAKVNIRVYEYAEPSDAVRPPEWAKDLH